MIETNRKWWPVEWGDEVMPPSRPSPDSFIINANGHFWLGYAFEATDVTHSEKRFYSRSLQPGEIVEFLYCDDLPEIEIEIEQGGADFTIVKGALDPSANEFWDGCDSDTWADSLETFAKNYAENERGSTDIWPITVSVLTCHCSTAPYKLAIYDETFEIRPRFELVPVTGVSDASLASGLPATSKQSPKASEPVVSGSG